MKHRPFSAFTILPALALAACTGDAPAPGDPPEDEPAAEATRPLPEGA